VILAIVFVVSIVVGLYMLATDGGIDLAAPLLIGGVVVIGLAWVVANFWLRLSGVGLGSLMATFLSFLKPQQWLWAIVSIVGPLVSFIIASSLPLSLFEPDYSLGRKECGQCGHPVQLGARAGQKCPHCGVYWSVESWRKDFDPVASRRVFALVLASVVLVVTLVAAVNNWAK
jgi:hypothetical protein